MVGGRPYISISLAPRFRDHPGGNGPIRRSLTFPTEIHVQAIWYM